MKSRYLILFITFLCISVSSMGQSLDSFGRPIDRRDTVGAVTHLFERKHKKGTGRAITFGILGIVTTILTVQAKGNAATDLEEPDPFSYVIIGYFFTMSAVGIGQTERFSKEKVKNVIQEYKAGQPIPVKICRRLRAKDFNVE